MYVLKIRIYGNGEFVRMIINESDKLNVVLNKSMFKYYKILANLHRYPKTFNTDLAKDLTMISPDIEHQRKLTRKLYRI